MMCRDALRCWPHLGPTARAAEASSCAVGTVGKPWGSPGRRPRSLPTYALPLGSLFAPRGSDPLKPAKPYDGTFKTPENTYKSLPVMGIVLTSRTSMQMQLQFNSNAYLFVRKTLKHPCAFWPISSSPVCVKSSLNSFPGQKSLSWIVFVWSSMVKSICDSPR